jgi:GT2 family glycosyltransferase
MDRRVARDSVRIAHARFLPFPQKELVGDGRIAILGCNLQRLFNSSRWALVPLARSSALSAARATIVVVPRERFSEAQESLESVLVSTEKPYELVYVDGGSPKRLRRWLQEQAAEHGFKLIRRARYLSPNEARNIGLAEVDTEFVAFLDNDVLVKPGWLPKLVECADETGAAAVGPLTCENDFDTVHFAGGEVEINEDEEDEEVARRVREKMYLAQRKVEAISDELVRQEVQLCEFHCVMARTEAMREIGGLDEGLLNTREHLDFSLSLAKNGGSVWFEPESVVAYMPPPPLHPSDIHFFMLRWSDDWERRSLDHFRRKWDLVEDDFFKRRLGRLGWRRQSVVVKLPVANLPFEKGKRTLERFAQSVEHKLNGLVTRRDARLRARGV